MNKVVVSSSNISGISYSVSNMSMSMLTCLLTNKEQRFGRLEFVIQSPIDGINSDY